MGGSQSGSNSSDDSQSAALSRLETFVKTGKEVLAEGRRKMEVQNAVPMQEAQQSDQQTSDT